jgi:sulfate transport system ATP-binding protein
VAKLNGQLVRPHDIRLGRDPDMALAQKAGTAESLGVTRATVERVVHLGFEVRVDLRNEATGERFSAQVTRGDSAALHLQEGETVYARATRAPELPEAEIPVSL